MSGTVEAFAVEAKLTLVTNVMQALGEASRAFLQFDELIARTKKNMEGLGLFKVGASAEALSSLRDMGRLSGNILEDQAKIAVEAGRTAAAWARTVEMMTKTGGRSPGGGGGGGNGSGGGGGHRGGGFDAMSAGIGLQQAGEAGSSFLERAFAADAEVEHVINLLRMNKGVDSGVVAEIRAKAASITKATPGLTTADALHVISDSFTTLGDIHEALAVAPSLAKSMLILQATSGAAGKDPGYAAMQAIELMQRHIDPKTHQVDPAAMDRELQAMTQVSVGTQGRVNPDAYLSFAKQARLGGMLANDDFIYGGLPAILIALGGSRAGTGEAATYRQFVQGRMTKGAAGDLAKLGLIDPKAHWANGRVADMDKHLKGANEFIANPVAWVTDVLLPTLKAHGVDTNDKASVGKALGGFASTATGLGFLSELSLGLPQILKEQSKIQGTTTDPMAILQDDPNMRLKQFQAAENDVLQTLGSALMGPALASMQGLSAWLHDLADWGKKNPGLATTLATATGGFTALATGLGTLATVVFIGSPLVAGIKALTGASAGFAPGSAAASGLGAAATGLSGLVAPVLALAGTLALIGLLGANRNADHGTPVVVGGKVSPRSGYTTPGVTQDPDGGFWGAVKRWMDGSSTGPTIGGGMAGRGGQGPTGSAGDPVHTVTTVKNGKDLARGVSDHMAREGARMSPGTSGGGPADGRGYGAARGGAVMV